ncbi:hypothetical protein Tco_0787421 [Tanacetum coccineum]
MAPWYIRSRSTETSDGLAAIQAQLNNLGREIKKVNEKVYAAQVGCEQCKGPPLHQDYPLKGEEGKTLDEGRIPFNWKNEGSYGTTFLGTYSEASHINNSIPRKEKDTGSFTLPYFINNVCFDNALVDLGARTWTVKYPKGIAENVLVGIGKFVFPVDFIILDIPEDIKVPLILGRPFLSTARAKIDVYKRKITLRVGEERIVFTRVKVASSLVKRVYMLSLRERMELDLEARIMGETLVLNRSLDPFFEDCTELNDLNEPFELRRNQGDNLIPTIEEGEVIEEFRTRDDELDVYDKNSFSYKIIYVDNLKTDSENDNDKVNMHSFLLPEPKVSYFDDLDYFKDFENEFPAIVYNDALTSKLDFLTEPTVSPQHVDEFNLKDKTSLSECDEEDQNVLYFNDLFHFNIIYPDDSKLDKDNDDNKIDIN